MADIPILRGLYLHSISIFFICVIFFILAFQLYNIWFLPHDAKRKWTIGLLIFVILRNLVEGLFQRPSAEIGIPLHVQHFLGHGFGYCVAAFFPVYWNATMNIKQLKPHALYGPFILAIPTLIIYSIMLPTNGDLRLVRTCAFIVPLVYGVFLIAHISLNIFNDHKTNINKTLQKDRLLILFSVTMWIASPVIGFYHPQWVEDAVINSIFILVNLLFVRKAGLIGKKIIQRSEYLSKDGICVFDLNCKKINLSPAESSIAKLYIDGMVRKDIAEKQNVVVSTIDWHISNIHKKAGTRSIKSRTNRRKALADILTCTEYL